MVDQADTAPGHHWREAARVAEYIERTDGSEDRDAGFEVMTKLLPWENDVPFRLLDIGSGQGIVAAAFLDAYPACTAFGLDVSEAMIEEGNERMAPYGDRFSYVLGDFGGGNLPESVTKLGPFDVVVSSKAIHHLAPEEIERLYGLVYANLSDGGCFLNFDAAAPPDQFLKNLFRSFKRSSGDKRRKDNEIRTLEEGETHSQDTTLLDHLRFLTNAGFASVDCYYKLLARAVVGGYKR
jgi:SAM-dependent methyltransferase